MVSAGYEHTCGVDALRHQVCPHRKGAGSGNGDWLSQTCYQMDFICTFVKGEGWKDVSDSVCAAGGMLGEDGADTGRADLRSCLGAIMAYRLSQAPLSHKVS